jgi:hypothetical protein
MAVAAGCRCAFCNDGCIAVSDSGALPRPHVDQAALATRWNAAQLSWQNPTMARSGRSPEVRNRSLDSQCVRQALPPSMAAIYMVAVYNPRVTVMSVVFCRSGIDCDTTRQTCVFERKVPRMECSGEFAAVSYSRVLTELHCVRCHRS